MEKDFGYVEGYGGLTSIDPKTGDIWPPGGIVPFSRPESGGDDGI